MIFPLTIGLLIPFAGTCLGASLVFFLHGQLSPLIKKAFSGFAAGVMISASFFSLLNPALELSNNSVFQVSAGFLVGILFLLVLDLIIPHMHMDHTEEGPHVGLRKTTKLVLAVTLHNIPEGMDVGIVFAGWYYGNTEITLAGALALAAGIALQNFPEGAIVSMPLLTEGMSKKKTFLLGALSGAVEPIGSVLIILASSLFIPLLPFLLSFAAGAMFYVSIEELIPELSEGEHSNIGTICFAAGFVIMMILDIVLG